MIRLLTNTALFAAIAVTSLASIATVEAGCGGGSRYIRSGRITTFPTTRRIITTRHITPVRHTPIHVAPIHVAPVHVAPVQVAPVEVAPQPVADRDYELLQVLRRNPNLAVKYRDLCIRLNAKFARFLPVSELIPLPAAAVVVQQTVAPAAVVQPRVEEAAPAPATAVTPAAVAPVAVTPPAAAPAAAPVAETPAVAAPPADLPQGIGTPSDLPPGLPTASAESTISPELKPLVGLWQAVSTKADGSQETTEVNLKPNGVAEVTIDSTTNGKTSLEGKVAVQDGNLNLLQAGDKTVTLGKVLLAQADKVQLQRGNETLTLTRP